MALNLVNVRGASPPTRKEPVILVHGAGVRGNIFRAPVQRTVAVRPAPVVPSSSVSASSNCSAPKYPRRGVR